MAAADFIITAIYVLAILCLWKSLQVALTVIEAASHFVGSNMRVIFVPVVFFAINLTVFVAWATALVYVYSVGDIDNGPPGS
jgi:hypothetical protein